MFEIVLVLAVGVALGLVLADEAKKLIVLAKAKLSALFDDATPPAV